jgi:hypothetical protein
MKKIIFITFLAVVVPLVVFGFIGCVKAPSTAIDYGSPVSETDVQGAVDDAVVNAAPTAPLSINKDQYVYIEHSQALDIYSPVVISQRADTVTDRTDTATTFDLGIDIQLNELQSDGTMKFSRSHSDLPLNKPTSPTAPDASANPVMDHSLSWIKALTTPQLVTIQDYSWGALKKKDQSSDPTEPKVTYYNLQKSSGVIPVPDLVKARTDCGGLAKCDTIRYVAVSFDRVVWDDDNNGTKTSIQYVFSPDVPTYVYDWANTDVMFFTTQISECAQQWVEQTSQGTTRYIPVRDCRDLLDFRFGPKPQ